MNRDDIIRMAREAMQSDPEIMGGTYFTLEVSDLERFAALVAAAERDRCILVLERLHERSGGQYNYYAYAANVLKGEI